MPNLPKFTLFRKKEPPLYLEAVSYEAYANALSILSIPHDQLADNEAHGELLRRALKGQEVYAYRPAHQEQWVVWIREGSPDREMRHYPAEWALKWHHEGEPKP